MSKITFIRDFNPYKKGDIEELSTQLTRHYISIYAAKYTCDCDSDESKEPCIECGDKPKEVISTITEPIKEEVVTEVVVPKKRQTKKK